jgi:protein MPE1
MSTAKGSAATTTTSQTNAFNPYLDQYSHKIPPPNYVCFRCNQRGHYISDCPTADDPAYDPPRVKRATGIPKSFLKSVEANTAGAMLGPEGNYVVFQQNE